MPKVSVIVSAYNQAKYLEYALNSVLNQTFEDWESIIVNDGSSDDAGEIANKMDKRFNLFSVHALLLRAKKGSIFDLRSFCAQG